MGLPRIFAVLGLAALVQATSQSAVRRHTSWVRRNGPAAQETPTTVRSLLRGPVRREGTIDADGAELDGRDRESTLVDIEHTMDSLTGSLNQMSTKPGQQLPLASEKVARQTLRKKLEAAADALAASPLTRRKIETTSKMVVNVETHILSKIVQELHAVQSQTANLVHGAVTATRLVEDAMQAGAYQNAVKVDMSVDACATDEHKLIEGLAACEATARRLIQNQTDSCGNAKAMQNKNYTLSAGGEIATCDLKHADCHELDMFIEKAHALAASAKMDRELYQAAQAKCSAAGSSTLLQTKECRQVATAHRAKRSHCEALKAEVTSAKCGFGKLVQTKCTAINKALTLERQVQDGHLSEADREKEWHTARRLHCKLIALRDQQPIDDESIAACVASLPYNGRVSHLSSHETLMSMLSARQPSCSESGAPTSRFVELAFGATASVNLNLDDGKPPFDFCGK